MSENRDHVSPSRGIRSALASSFTSGSPLAERALAEDIAACSTDEDDDDASLGENGRCHRPLGGPGSSSMNRRPSGVAYGSSRPVFNPQSNDEPGLTPLERKQSRSAERSLLRDNHVLPPKQPDAQRGFFSRLSHRLFGTEVPQTDDYDPPVLVVQQPSETSPLIGGDGGVPERAQGTVGDNEDPEQQLDEQWAEAVRSGQLRTTWQRETKTIVSYSAPLTVTFFLQYSINVASVIAVGRLGTAELGAVSLANMSQAITCMAPFQGLATSLDTLCAQAYGSGHRHLVGLLFQRMTWFLFCLSVPVAVLWWHSEPILRRLVPEPESARLASIYLRVMIFNIPGFILFECGKRFTQAQGLFRATTYVLLVAAPMHILILWLCVSKLELGFVGAPIAVAITETTLPVFLFLYVRFVDGAQCWGGFSRRAFSNWWTMIRLALPGMIMVEAEWMAFDIMTLLASQFGAEYLASQSALVTLSTISYQLPFPMSIAASTRVANLIGAGLVDAAKTAARVTFVLALIIGVLNLIIYSTLRFQLPLIFTHDSEVIAIVAKTLPIVGVMQVFDGLSAGAHGLLRGIGKQSIGGPANLIAYYAISLPISVGLGFGLDWKLDGLWLGLVVGLTVVSIIEYLYLAWTNWDAAAREAASRNAAG